MTRFRIGIGFDIHRLVEGRPLVLAGVEVASPTGCLGHSDGDVVLHALADAVLGAAGLGDIGEHFPDDDPTWEGADSAEILARTLELVAEAGWHVAQADVNLVLERPKLGATKTAMRRRLAELLDTEAVNLKARTLEGLGPIGEGRAAAAQAVVMLNATE